MTKSKKGKSDLRLDKIIKNGSLIIILVLSLAFCVLVISNSGQEQTSTRTPSYADRQVSYSIVYMGGLDNGECLVPRINLWDSPQRTRVVDVVPGCVGLPVQVIDTRTVNDLMFYHVRTYGANAGKQGWVSKLQIIS